jgi:hypothetical protein
MSMRGRWQGKLVDASGVSGLLTMDLKDSRGELSGDFTVSFLPPGDDGCSPAAPTLAQSGSVQGTTDAKTGKVEIGYEMSVGLEPVTVRFTGTQVKAIPHAARAVFGCFDLQKGGGALTLDGGACVLWQYRDARKRGRIDGR